jgi:hypothetical protein
VDTFSQQRVLELRQEIASLQHDNDSYRLHKRQTAEDAKLNEVRRIRLLAIREELFRMTEPYSRGKRLN